MEIDNIIFNEKYSGLRELLVVKKNNKNFVERAQQMSEFYNKEIVSLIEKDLENNKKKFELFSKMFIENKNIYDNTIHNLILIKS